MKKFFEPKSVAIIGASHKPGKVGYEILKNFLNFPGKVFPINPNTEPILGMKVYASVLDVKEKIDLAIIAVPAKIVKKVLEECGKKRIKAVIIISAGFSEIGKEGKKLEEELKKVAKRYKIRVIGPNVIGIYCPKTKVDTLFLSQERLKRPKKGNIAFISQSGAVGSTILDWMAEENLGISKFISYGNAMDINEIDLLKFLAKDKETKVIAIYLEGIKASGKEFAKVLKKVAKKKPVIILKAGKTEKGAKAVLSHTGSLAGSHQIYSALFKQFNAIEVSDWEELFDLCKLFSMQKLPKGKKVLIITNGGGFGVLATDEAEKRKIELNPLPKKVKKRVKKKLPPYIILENPVDLTGDANAERYNIILQEVAKEYDAIVCITLLQVPTLEEKIVDVLARFNKKYKKTIVCCACGGAYTKKLARKIEEKGIPVYPTPERAIRALAKMIEWQEF